MSYNNHSNHKKAVISRVKSRPTPAKTATTRTRLLMTGYKESLAWEWILESINDWKTSWLIRLPGREIPENFLNISKINDKRKPFKKRVPIHLQQIPTPYTQKRTYSRTYTPKHTLTHIHIRPHTYNTVSQAFLLLLL